MFAIVCKTVDSPGLHKTLLRRKAVIGKECIFPFKLDLNNKTYNSCTYDFSHVTAGQAWCSTKVDNNGYHIKRNGDGTKNWGICNDDEFHSSTNSPIEPKCKYHKLY